MPPKNSALGVDFGNRHQRRVSQGFFYDGRNARKRENNSHIHRIRGNGGASEEVWRREYGGAGLEDVPSRSIHVEVLHWFR